MIGPADWNIGYRQCRKCFFFSFSVSSRFCPNCGFRDKELIEYVQKLYQQRKNDYT